jgi:hypothetical protein
MDEKTFIYLVFTLCAVAVFPFAVAFHSHLYADGAYFFTVILEQGGIASIGHTPARMGHHILTQAPVMIAMRCGITNIRLLSRLYGICLLYLPLAAFFLACHLFLRAKMISQALLAAMLYCILTFFTATFIVSESHLASALFVLTLATIVTTDMRKKGPKTALLVLWLLTLSVYEFWVLFFPVCFVVLITRPRAIKSYQMCIILGILYLSGTVLNTFSILFTALPDNRNAMFGICLASVWRQILAAILLFLAAISVTRNARFLRIRRMNGFQRSDKSAGTTIKAHGDFFIVFLISILSTIACAGIMFYRVGTPWDAYNLRTLNLILPVLFGLSLVPGCGNPARRHCHSNKTAVYGLMAMLILTICLRLFHVAGFLEHKKRLFAVTQAMSGYVTVQSAVPYEIYGWFWTYPTMSVLLQAIEKRPVKTIIYDPDVPFQPYGPAEFQRTRNLLSRLDLSFADDARMEEQASDITARSHAEPAQGNDPN